MSKSSEAVAACRRQIEAQLDKVRSLNASEAPIDAVSSEVAALQALSAQLGELSLSKKGGQKGKITLKTPKGTRDWEPLSMSLRKHVFSTIERVFSTHGAVTIDTPVFELK